MICYGEIQTETIQKVICYAPVATPTHKSMFVVATVLIRRQQTFVFPPRVVWNLGRALKRNLLKIHNTTLNASNLRNADTPFKK